VLTTCPHFGGVREARGNQHTPQHQRDVNLGVQLFEFVHARQFRHVPEATSRFQTKHYHILPPFTFLCRLRETLTVNTSGVELSAEDKFLFTDLQMGLVVSTQPLRLRGPGKRWLNWRWRRIQHMTSKYVHSSTKDYLLVAACLGALGGRFTHF